MGTGHARVSGTTEARGAYHSPSAQTEHNNFLACGVSVGTRETSVCRGGEQKRKETGASNRGEVLGSRPRGGGGAGGKGRRGNGGKQGSRQGEARLLFLSIH